MQEVPPPTFQQIIARIHEVLEKTENRPWRDAVVKKLPHLVDPDSETLRYIAPNPGRRDAFHPYLDLTFKYDQLVEISVGCFYGPSKDDCKKAVRVTDSRAEEVYKLLLEAQVLPIPDLDPHPNR